VAAKKYFSEWFLVFPLWLLDIFGLSEAIPINFYFFPLWRQPTGSDAPELLKYHVLIGTFYGHLLTGTGNSIFIMTPSCLPTD